MSQRHSLLLRIAVVISRCLDAIGFNAIRCCVGIRGLPAFVRDAWGFGQQPSAPGFQFGWGIPAPCLADRYLAGGTASGAYFHQDLWAARHIYRAAPRRHIDVGSRVDGFVAHVATFRSIEILDIRPPSGFDPNISFRNIDVMSKLAPDDHGCCDSLSCLHALEHFGLGRYGDPVKADGFLDGWENLYNLLQPGGVLYFSVPIGPPRVEFNAHRVFSIEQINQLIRNKYSVIESAYVDDSGAIHPIQSWQAVDVSRNFDCDFGCALLALRKHDG
jgi:SAM-dependent methyltransferase